MKNKLPDLAYFAFLCALYVFLKNYSQEEEICDIITFSYPLFLEVINRFATIMALKGWGRQF